MGKILTIILALSLFSCTSDSNFETGKKQLEAQGYTDVIGTGHDWFCCSKDDATSNGFTAKDKFGNSVKGCICGSYLFKGVTIRFE